jgi:hypothetical protein
MAKTNKKTISIEVRDEYILGSGVSIGAAGSYDSVILQVKFDDSWAGLSKYATWTNALGEMADQTIITPFNGVDGLEDTYNIHVPAPAAKYAGTVKLSFTGYALSRSEGDRTVESLINTASGSFRVLESNADPLDGAGTAPSVAQQLLNQLDAHMNEVNGEVDEIENSVSLVEGRMTVVEGNMKAVEGAEAERSKTFVTSETERKETFEKAESQRQSDFEAAEAERNQIVGDLNKALDEIIARQKSFIGGGA